MGSFMGSHLSEPCRRDEVVNIDNSDPVLTQSSASAAPSPPSQETPASGYHLKGVACKTVQQTTCRVCAWERRQQGRLAAPIAAICIARSADVVC